ncbi:disulfide oxidoreductase [Candidatus Woesearchaeota archaeon CG10_big_fil_rev_8_21_14_0_10_36_11]|nr:MAG: disulfide oxidoreductase [Candidatus Woesearchaeota archaeon CG10_big_fil_rev_8_21_14_0_10_36_11]
MQSINKEMTIGEIIQRFPSAVEILMDEGVHCIGCGAVDHETIEDGLIGHQKTEEEIDAILKRMNENILQKQKIKM